MKKYLSFFKLRLNIALQYRTAAIAGMFTQFFWAIMQILIFQAFYKVVTSNSISLQQLISYVWLKQAFYAISSAASDTEIKDMIEKGNISYELCRPTSLYWMWFFKTLANKLAAGILKSIPILIVAPFLPFGLSLSAPASFFALILFVVSLFFAICIMSALINAFYISIFYTMSSKGTNSIFYATLEFFGGTFVPIALMPKFWQSLCYKLPFSLAADLPYRIYSGSIGVQSALMYIVMQIGWLLVLTISGTIIMNKKLKNVVIQGG